jgi:hypothetical protein
MLTALLAASFIGCAPTPATIKFDGDAMMTVNTLDAVPLKTAKVLDKAGKPIAQAPKITWTVTPETVAKLEGDKAVKPLANGEATVTATIGNVKGTYQVVVLVPNKIEIAGYDVAKPIPVGANQVLKANVMADTKPVEGQKVMWKAADDKIATVANGKVTGVAAGKTTVSATLGTLEAKLEVEIVAAEPVKDDVKKVVAIQPPKGGKDAKGGNEPKEAPKGKNKKK